MAAAFAALVSLQNNLHLIRNHPRHSFAFEHTQIQSLWNSVCFFIGFMESYDASYGVRKEAAEALEMRIARVAQAAEDVIETHVVDQIRSGRTRSKFSCCFLLDVQKAIEDMEYMKRKAIDVKARSGMETEQQHRYSAGEALSPKTLTSNKTTMVGFADVLLRLLDNLTGLPSSRQVIPIVGMGGIGKTTLAKNAIEHPYILQHFDVCLWATLSQQYSLKKITEELLSGLRKFTSKTIDESTSCGTFDEARVGLHKGLYGRRYLIILDDMWSVEAWDDMKLYFPDTDNGSRIVVTTRHSDVADYLSISWFKMHFLNEDNSWDLFCQKIFALQVCPHELEEIGKKIVEKCKGLPLAIVVVGGHLKKSSMTKEYWENVAHDMNSILDSTEKDDEQCLNVLSLSYSYLPVHLKPCFLLIEAYPEEVYGWDVVRLWIAEGFIESFLNKSLEEVGQDYLWELCERNLIIVDEFAYNGDIHTLKLHDTLRELCRKISKKEEFVYLFDSPRPMNMERRVVISGEMAEVNDHQSETSDVPLRCLICRGEEGRLTNGSKLLRALIKNVTSSTQESMFQQVNLRYLSLDLDYTCRPTLYLPSSISLLWNLQILMITVANDSTVVAPYEIWEMLQLRHLQVEPISLVDPLPTDILDDQANDVVMRNLHILLEVENFRLSEEVCRRMPNIIELQLSYSGEASSYYFPQNLCYFHELEYLLCDFDLNFKWRDFALSLTFPPSLKRLHLSGCRLDWEELEMMVGALPGLLSLALHQNAVVGSLWNPVEGNYLSLRSLDICGCDDLIHWNADSSSFPVLERLLLGGLSKLDEFPSGIGEIPTMEMIEVYCCSISSTISTMRTLMEQEKEGNDDLELDVNFRGDEKTLESFNKQVREEGLESRNLVLHLRRMK